MAIKRKARMGSIVFVTGTDTGVGKTIFTALMLDNLRTKGVHAHAMKPFCSGGRGDADLLWDLQDREIPIDAVNPYHFSKPIAPAIAACEKRVRITKSQVLRRIHTLARQSDCLLVEGAGGIFVPVGKGFMIVDLIQSLGCPTIVVTRDCLGTINHTLLTVEALRNRGIRNISVVLMGQKTKDESVRSNAQQLIETLENTGVFAFPHVANLDATAGKIKHAQKKFKKLLRAIINRVISTSLRATPVERARCSEKNAVDNVRGNRNLNRVNICG